MPSAKGAASESGVVKADEIHIEIVRRCTWGGVSLKFSTGKLLISFEYMVL
jgi:hypothetical protein